MDLVEVVDHPHRNVEHNIDSKEANDEIGYRTLFCDPPHTTDNELSLGTTIGSDGICTSHRKNVTNELYNKYFSNK